MGKKLLIVDDSIFVFEEIKYLLKDTDYQIVGYAKDGCQAIQMYKELKPDVVTMDIIMPGIDGIDTTKLLIDEWKEARIVVVSSLAYDETKEKAGNVGACGFVFKPLDKEDFIKALDEAVQEK